jgi:transcriptional regulator with XRE-family HTH domain
VSVLGDNITALRKYKGYTRKDMESLLGINTYTYRGWEYGTYEPKIEYLIRLSQLFRVSIDELVGNVIQSEKTHIQLSVLE